MIFSQSVLRQSSAGPQIPSRYVYVQGISSCEDTQVLYVQEFAAGARKDVVVQLSAATTRVGCTKHVLGGTILVLE